MQIHKKKHICVLLSINVFHGAEDDPGYKPPRWCLVGTFRSSSLLESLPRTQTNKQPQLQKQAQYFFDDLLSSILFINNYL